MFETWGPRLGITEDESDFACRRGLEGARRSSTTTCRRRAARSSRRSRRRTASRSSWSAGRTTRIPGLNHGIPEEFQVLGYPILSMRSIPKDPRVPRRATSRRSSRAGSIKTPLELSDVWPENYSANSAQKVWAAKFAARHPNVVVLDLSSFKCGHDAPTYGLIDSHHRDVGDALRGAARHRRQQAGRLDQDPRQDLRPRAQAPRGAPRGRRRKRSDELRARDRREAARAARAEARSSSTARKQQDPALDAQIDELRAKRRRRTCDAGRRGPSRPEGHRAARQEDQGRGHRAARHQDASTTANRAPLSRSSDGERQ